MLRSTWYIYMYNYRGVKTYFKKKSTNRVLIIYLVYLYVGETLHDVHYIEWFHYVAQVIVIIIIMQWLYLLTESFCSSISQVRVVKHTRRYSGLV